MEPAAPRFSRRIPVAKLPRHGQRLQFAADPAECADIAAILAVPRVDSLSAEIEVRPASGGRYVAEGRVKARVWQTCVVTLEDFPTDIDTVIEAMFAEDERLPPASRKEVERTLEDEDPPEPLDTGAVDAGALAVEFVALALDPFPRRPDAALDSVVEDEPERESPFAALAALKGKGIS